MVFIRRKDRDRVTYYRVYDTCSGSIMLLGPESMKQLILNNMAQVINAKIEKNKLMIKDWQTGVYTNESEFEGNCFVNKKEGASHVLLAAGDTWYKVANSDGIAHNMGSEAFKKFVELGKIINPDIEKVHTIHKDVEFEVRIKQKYNNFIAKTILLGFRDITFDYKVENKEVRLSSYTGNSKEVILPPFITAIMAGAFRAKGIKAVKFSDGLKIIGYESFFAQDGNNGLERVEIPKTVELVGNNAFRGNSIMARSDGTPNDKRFILIGDKTTVSEQSL